MLNDMDLATATLEDLEGIELDAILGGDVSKFDLSDGLPTCTVGVVLEDFEIRRYAADIENNKKARIDLSMKFKITHAFSCDDSDIDPQSLVGRYHYENIPLHMDFGPKRIARIILGACGISFRDKAAWANLNGSFAEALEGLKANLIQFGVQLRHAERNGYENTNIVDKEKAFVSMQAYPELVAAMG